jgi:hypothetical protein
MANETTTTTLNDLVNGYVISSTMLAYAQDYIVAHDKFRYWSLMGQNSNVLQVARITADFTVDNNGTSFDTEFDATEGTALSNTALDTENVQFTVSEYGVVRSITDNVYEDSIMGPSFLSIVVQDATHLLAMAVEQAATALFASLSNTVGSTGVDPTIANFITAADGIRTRGTNAPDGVVAVLDNQTWSDLKTAAIATSTSVVTYGASALQIAGLSATHSYDMRRMVGTIYGIPVFESTVTPTANAGADVVSAIFTPTGPGTDPHATFSYVEKRPFRLEVERDALARADVAVFTRRCAVGESADFSGTALIVDA